MLKNLKILDFTTLLPGPYATFLLASMGAKVTKVSAPGKTDLVLEGGPRASSGETANRIWLHHNKEEIFVDLKSEAGLEKILGLLKAGAYNCIFEQFRPGVMDKLGLGYEAVKKLAPDMVYVSISGYGQEGVYAHRAGHDINYLALSGNMSYSGRADGGPALYGMQAADIAASQNAVIGALAAHNQRLLTGKGAHVDVAILDSAIPFNAMSGAGAMLSGENPRRENQLLNGGSLYDFYPTSDGGYMSVGALEPKFWAAFCNIMGHPDWIEAGCACEDFQEKKEILRREFSAHTRDYWSQVFAKADACVEPVLTVTEALLDWENARNRGSVVNVLAEEKRDSAVPEGAEAGDGEKVDGGEKTGHSKKYEEDEIWIYGNPIKFR